MSAIYRQSPDAQGATEMSSQSRVLIGTRTRPRTAPFASRAKRTAAFPESLCDQSKPGLRRLTARPLDSGSSGIIVGPLATTHGPGAVSGGQTHMAKAMAATASATMAASGVILAPRTECDMTSRHPDRKENQNGTHRS